MSDHNNAIEVNPKIMMGKPVIKGTRITVEMILEKLSSGESFEELLEAHPRLSKSSIYAALAFAASALKGEKIYPIAV
ncbi:MAG: DUF433 domain-containing protein [Bacteroidota bacterium]